MQFFLELSRLLPAAVLLACFYLTVLFTLNRVSSRVRISWWSLLSLGGICVSQDRLEVSVGRAGLAVNFRALLRKVSARDKFISINVSNVYVKLPSLGDSNTTNSKKSHKQKKNSSIDSTGALATILKRCFQFRRFLFPFQVSIKDITVELAPGIKIELIELLTTLDLTDDQQPTVSVSFKDLAVGTDSSSASVKIFTELLISGRAKYTSEAPTIKDTHMDVFLSGVDIKLEELTPLLGTLRSNANGGNGQNGESTSEKAVLDFTKIRSALNRFMDSFSECVLRIHECSISLSSTVFSVQSVYVVGRGMGAGNPVSTKLSDSSLAVFGSRGKCELLTSITSLKISGAQTKNMTYVPFFSMLNYVDVLHIVDFFENESAKTEDAFIRTIVTFNNPTFAWNLTEMHENAPDIKSQTDSPVPSRTSKIPKKLFLLLQKCKLRVYFLNADFRINMSSRLTLSFTSTEVSLDLGEYQQSEPTFSEECSADTPEIELSLKTRHISIAYYLDDKSRASFFSIKNASSTAVVTIPKDTNDDHMLEVHNLNSEVNDIVCLLDDVDLFFAFAEVSRAVSESKLKRPASPTASPTTKKPKLVSVVQSRLSFKRSKFLASFKNPRKFYNNVDYTELNSYARGFELTFEELDIVLRKDKLIDVNLNSFIGVLITDISKRAVSRTPFVKCSKTVGHICPRLTELNVILPVVELNIDIETVWTLLFVKAIISAVLPEASPDHKLISKAPKRHENGEAKLRPKMSWSVDLGVLIAHWKLPYEEELLIELDTLKVAPSSIAEPHGFNSSLSVMRLYVPSTFVKKGWSALLELTHVDVFVFSDHGDPDQEFAAIKATMINISVPLEYMLYKSLDNVVSFFKSSRQISVNFEDLMSPDASENYRMKKIMPHPVKPLKMPKVRIEADAFNFLFSDDPFEVKLNRIYQLGLIEQLSRMRKQAKFEETEKAILKEVERRRLERINGTGAKKTASSPLGNNHQKVRSLKSTVLGIKIDPNVNMPLVQNEHDQEYREMEEARKTIEKARRKLYANISRSWITRFEASEEEKAQALHHLSEQYQGKKVPASAELLERFKIFERDEGFPLFVARFTNLELVLDVPQSFELDNYAKFLHDRGDGMPTDMEYSILIPMNLSIRCKTVHVRVKDYPLPMLSFVSGKENPILINGDIVIAEQMAIVEELRWVFVSLVSQYKDPEKKECLYAMNVPRTLTAVKVYMDMHIKVDSDIASSISWSESYQPGLGYAMSAFDVLSKPPLDISPKIGFWDKFRLNMHGRFNFDFTGDLNLFIKSTACPYDLIGTAAGFVFSWQDGVNLKINYSASPEEFLVVQSNKFEIGVPNFSNLQREYWLLANTQGKGINFTLHKKVMKLNAAPVVWKMGFLFERDTQLDGYVIPGTTPRTSQLVPHYEVRLRNPSTFNSDIERKSWDSYRGFKSRYIHMSISVESSGDNAYSSLHLSPMLFRHFFAWWESFSLISLPIKEGKIFRHPDLDYRKKPKFGKSMFTIKYKLNLAPLFLSHIYRHASSDDFKSDNKVAFTGLKCAIKRFTMDLHQRKQEFRLVKDELGLCMTDWHLKMNQGELDLEEADLRLLTAVFNERAVQGYLAKAFGIDSSSSHSQTNDSYTSKSDFSKNKNVWWDLDDFIEIEQPDLKSDNPKWEIIPFASSPRVSYFRQAPTPDTKYPFGEEWSHECLIGKNHPERTQETLARQRQVEIEKEIGVVESSLDSLHLSGIKDAGTTNRIRDLNRQLESLKHSLHVIRSILDDLAEGMLPEADEFSLDTEQSELGRELSTTRSGSIYSTDSKALRLSKTQSAKESFISMRRTSVGHSSPFWNRFIVHNMLLSWNSELSEKLLRYIYNVSERKSLCFYLTRKAVTLAEELMKEASSSDRTNCGSKSNLDYEFRSPKESVDEFDDVIEDYPHENAKVFDTYLVKLISPQIRLISKKDADKCLLLASRDVTLKVVKVYCGDSELDGSAGGESDLAYLIQTRYGLLMNDALVYVLDKQKMIHREYGFFHFDEEKNWPPSLPIEMCYDGSALTVALCIEKQSFGFIYYKPNPLFLSHDVSNASTMKYFQAFFPKLAIIMDMEQYQVIYNIANDLLAFSDPEIKKNTNRLEKLLSATETNDFTGMSEKVETLQKEVRILNRIKLVMKMLDSGDSKIHSDDLLIIDIELEKLLLELSVTMQILQKAQSLLDVEHMELSKTVITFDQIILHLLDEEHKPFVDIAIAQTFFAKLAAPDASSTNQISIRLIQVFDLHGGCKYPQILSPRDAQSVQGEKLPPMLFLEWRNLQPVGGIGVIDKSLIRLQPIILEIDHSTAKKLAKFFELGDAAKTKADSDSDVASLFSDSDAESFDSKLSPVLSSSSSSITSSQTHGSNPVSKLKRNFLSLRRKNSDHASIASSTVDDSVSFSEERKSPTSDSGVIEMVERSSKYKLWNLIDMGEATICISFKGTGPLSIINVERLVLKIAPMKYTNKMWSKEELFMHMRKEILRSVLRHTGKFIGNKLVKHTPTRTAVALPQVKDYNSYTKFDDLGAKPTKEDTRIIQHGHDHIYSHHHRPAHTKFDPALLEPVSAAARHKPHHSQRTEPVDINTVFEAVDDVEDVDNEN
ncbi:unnamed protein product [Kuraishia capsulata CBS 1993]|uniref:Uncharacterized protein n=1 Tax=Kuraishia capsulata CBS 1993 TaxID=1382522 RepID=W6MND4_9ASCO|nr:uncharacterized protein KUCA_T00004155001 [Kuraishia capsulata CBS 1993]CDK28174.1 unnamed protein product [Kuraishia capsulata CBS 1993]